MKSRISLVILVILAISCHKKEKADTHSSSTVARDSMTYRIAYRAHGNEPFWNVTIDGNGMRFTSPEDSTGVMFPSVEPATSGDTLRWTSKSDKGRIVVIIWPDSCNDGMSDQTYSHASAVKLNETSYQGCAESTPAPR